MADLTRVTVSLDQHALQTIKMGLAAIQLSAQAVGVDIDAQVEAQIKSASEVPAPTNGKRPNGQAATP